jgi:hypothetical protein
VLARQVQQRRIAVPAPGFGSPARQQAQLAIERRGAVRLLDPAEQGITDLENTVVTMLGEHQDGATDRSDA